MDNLNITNFKELVEESKGYVLIDFFATWCGPCRMMSPIIDKINEKMDELKVYKVDVDKNQALAEKFNIMSIPTILIFKDGILNKQFVGLTSEENITEVLK